MTVIDADTHQGRPGSWIGPTPSPTAIAALLTLGTVGMMITGVQPVVFGTLLREGRLTAAQLGQATTAEFLGIGIGVLVAGALLRPRNLRWYAAGSGLALLVANLLSTTHSGSGLLADRALAGLAGGILLWLPSCMIARSPRPAFWSAIFVTMQTLAQLTYVAVLPVTALGRLGSNGCLISLALTGGIAIAVSPAIPTYFQELTSSAAAAGSRTTGTRRALVFSSAAALVAMFLAAAFEIGLYAYFEPLSVQAGLDQRVLDLAVTATLVGQVAGSTLAAVAAKRVRHFPVLTGWAVINLGLLLTFASMPQALAFIAAAALFGFVWLFFMPFQLPLTIEADPTRRAAVLLPGAQLLGGAVGPFLCSLAVTNSDVRSTLAVCGACLLATVAISGTLHYGRRRYMSLKSAH
jgi:predicted MFS family arabinose efflux permease